jgi:hypothetical protein
MSYVFSVIAILVCGLAGAVLAWTVVDTLGWTGIGGAIVAAIIGMVSGTLLWACGVLLGGALGLRRK